MPGPLLIGLLKSLVIGRLRTGLLRYLLPLAFTALKRLFSKR